MMRQKTNKKRSQFYEFWLPIHCGRFIDYYDISSSQKVVNFRALKQSKKKGSFGLSAAQRSSYL